MFATWTTRPIFIPYVHRRTDWFQLARRWEVRLGDQLKLVVPEGFITDGPSIPWLVQPLTPVTGSNRIPATVHDALYAIKGGGKVTRKEADQIFYESLGPSLNSRMIWLGVRLGGFGAWMDESEADRINDEQSTLPFILDL